MEPAKARQFSKLLLSTTQPTLHLFALLIHGELASGRTSSSPPFGRMICPPDISSTQPTLHFNPSSITNYVIKLKFIPVQPRLPELRIQLLSPLSRILGNVVLQPQLNQRPEGFFQLTPSEVATRNSYTSVHLSQPLRLTPAHPHCIQKYDHLLLSLRTSFYITFPRLSSNHPSEK